MGSNPTLSVDEAYFGCIVYGKTKHGKFSVAENSWQDKLDLRFKHDAENWVIAEDAHEPIIAKEVFLKAQKIRAKRGKGNIGNPYGSKYLLTGIMFCENCNERFSGGVHKVNERSYYYYQDEGYMKKGKSICQSTYIPQHKVDDFALDKIKERLESEFWRTRLAGRLKQRFDSKEIKHNEIDKISAEIKRLENEIDNLLEAIAVSGITEILKKKIGDRQNKLELMKSLRDQKQNEGRNQQNSEMVIGEYLKYFDDMSLILQEATNDEKKKIIRGFIDRVLVNKKEGEIKFHFFEIPYFNDENVCAFDKGRRFDIYTGHKTELEVLAF